MFIILINNVVSQTCIQWSLLGQMKNDWLNWIVSSCCAILLLESNLMEKEWSPCNAPVFL